MEGSVEVDNGMPSLGDSFEETQEETTEETTESTEEEVGETTEDEGQEYTDKGTKLDKNPLSAAHQQLANERRVRETYERVLNSPELLRKYAKEAGYTLAEAKAEIKEEKSKYSGEGFKTGDDVAKVFTQHEEMIESLRQQNEQLVNELKGLSGQSHALSVTNKLQSEVAAVREKYPELDPKSSSYDKELQTRIGNLYNKIDYDPDSRAYRGNFSLVDLADEIMFAAGKAEKKGSEKAQTIIKQRQSGKIVTSSKKTDTSTKESDDPGTVIAQRIAKALRG